MARIAFKRTPDTPNSELEFKEIQGGNLISTCYEFAKTFDKNVYEAIMLQKVSIILNDEVVEVDDWCTTIISDDTIIICSNVEDDSGWLMIGVGAILMIAAPHLAGLGFAFGIEGLTWSALAFGLGLSFALGGLSNLLFQPDIPSLSSVSSSKQTQTYNWTGIKTTAREDTPIPILYGTHPIGGNVISLFIENYGGDSYLNMLLGLCEGEIEGICQEGDLTSVCTTSDKNSDDYRDPAIRIDDQPLRFYNDIEWGYRTGTSTQTKLLNFDGTRMQYDDGREVPGEYNLQDGSQYLEYITSQEIDEVVLNFYSPQLFNAEGSDITNETIKYKVEYSTDGVTYYQYEGPGTYKYVPQVTATIGNANYVTCTSYVSGPYKYSYKEPTYKIIITGMTLYGKAEIVLGYNLDIYKQNGSNYDFFKSVDTFSYSMQYDHNFTPDNMDKEIILGEYQIAFKDRGIRKGDTFIISSVVSSIETSSDLIITAKSKTPIYNAIRLDFTEAGMPGNGIYYIRATRTDGGKSDSLKVSDNLILGSVIEVIKGNFTYPYTALVGFRIKASGQLSGSPPNIITYTKGMKIEVPDLSESEAFQDCYWDDTDNRWEYSNSERTWDNSTYTSTKEYCNNSMLCVRDLSLSERYGLGEYFSSSDFNTSEIVTTIRECWKKYDAYIGEDYFSWWDTGTDTDWKDSIHHKLIYPEVIKTYDSSARTVTVTGTGKYTTDNPDRNYTNFLLKLSPALKIGQIYEFSITLSNVNFPVIMTLYGLKETDYLGDITGVTNGTHTVTFTAKHAYGIIDLIIKGINASPSYTITDISLTKDSGSIEHYHTWNGIIESGQSALTVLLEMCDVFRCWPVWHSGKINFISDRDTTPIHTLSVGNTESFAQTFTPLSEIPYRLIGQFTDEARDYRMRSLVSLSTATDLLKINEKTIGLKGLTSKAKAERELKFKHNKIVLCNNTITMMCGVDIIHGASGDIINVQDDLPMWGHGGNILTYTATNLTIDTKYTFSNAATNTFTVKYQGIDNSQLTATIDTTNIVTNASLQTFPIINLPASPCELSAFSLNTSGYQSKKFRIISTNRTEEDKIEVIAIEHFSSLYDSEATLAIIEDHSPLEPPINPNVVPKPPKNISITALPASEGIGFSIGARPDPSDYNITEIVVQFDRTGNREFETIGTLIPPQWATIYIDTTLKFETLYRFKLFCKTTYKIGTAVEVSSKIPLNEHVVAPPKGLRIKGQTLNSNQFDGKDVTIIWDSPGLSTDLDYSIRGYKVNVYKDSITNANLLRTDFTSSEEYTYTYDMNKGDNGTANSTLVFQLTTLTTNGWESLTSSHITVSNSSPSAPVGLTATPWMKGVQFRWNKNTETDLDYYSYRTKGIVGTLPYSSGTGTFTAGERIIQWDDDGSVLASALIDSVTASYLYISDISGDFTAGKIVGTKDYGSELVTNGNNESAVAVFDAEDYSQDASYAQSNEQANGGTYSAKVLCTSTTYGSGFQHKFHDSNESKVSDNSFFVISADFYLPSGQTTSQCGWEVYHNGAWGTKNLTSLTDQWVTLSLTFFATDDFYAILNSNQTTYDINDYYYADNISIKQLTNAALAGILSLDTWSSWNSITNTEVSRFLNEDESSQHPDETTIYIQVKAVDVYANESATAAISGITLGLNIKPTDISNFAITSSKIFNKIPVITGDTWSDNTVLASEVQWNSHNLYYNGTLCVVASGHTSDKYIYWRNLATSYSTSATHPSSLSSPLGDNDFIIAVNIDGTHDLAWNAIANQVIGSAYIQNLAVQEAHINNLAVTTAKINDLAVTTAKIDNLAVTSAKVASLNAIKIVAGSITATQLSANSINATHLKANCITANEIRGTNFGTLTISSGKIVINTTDALEIQSSGNIKVLAGGDIQLIGDNSNPGLLRFIGSSSNITAGLNAAGSTFSIMPTTAAYCQFYIGSDTYNFYTVYFKSDFEIYLDTQYSSTKFAKVRVSSDTDQNRVSLWVSRDGTDQYVQMRHSWAEGPFFIPGGHKTINCGSSTTAWDFVVADDFSNVADFYYLDTLDDLSELHKIKGSGIIDENTGLELIDDNTLPEFLLTKHKRDGTEVKIDENSPTKYIKRGEQMLDPDGKPYISLKATISHLWGCIRQLDNKFINLTASLNR